jgi:uncharacterized protein Yka (UPF0111/DUF47 family)
MLQWFRALLPNEEKFVQNFEEHAGHIVAASLALRGLMDGKIGFDEAFRTIREREGAADGVTKKTFEAIHRTFITPFDRSEIHDLIVALDDTIDLIEDIVQRLAIYEIAAFTPQMQSLAATIETCATRLRTAIPCLAEVAKNAEALKTACREISVLEGKADATLRDGLKALMKCGADPIAIMTRKEIYELLEQTIDRCEDVADVIQGIVIEHA